MFTHSSKKDSNKTNAVIEKTDKHKIVEPKSLQRTIGKSDLLLSPQRILQLQRTIGNQAVIQLLISQLQQSGEQPLQRTEPIEDEEELQIKHGNAIQMEGFHEKENELQMKLDSEAIQRMGSEEDEEKVQILSDAIQKEEMLEEDEETLQMKRENTTGMPDRLKAGVENLSGIDMSDVRVHYNSDKPVGLGALAYTQGADIHVAPGQEKHLPHEAWHVVQQAQGRVQPTMLLKGVVVNDDPGLEREADDMGERAIIYHDQINVNRRGTHKQSLSSINTTIKKRAFSGEVAQMVLAIINWDNNAPPRISEVITARGGDERNDTEGGTIPITGKTTGGAHITAFSVYESAVIRNISNKTYHEAVIALTHMIQEIKSLPGYTALTGTNKEKFDRHIDQQYQYHEESVRTAVSELHRTQLIQNMIIEYLKLRNSIPYAIDRERSGDKKQQGFNKNEQIGIDCMLRNINNEAKYPADHGGKRGIEYANGMWHVLDLTTTWALQEIVAQLIQHIRTCFSCYPIVDSDKRNSIINTFLRLIVKNELDGMKQKDVQEIDESVKSNV